MLLLDTMVAPGSQLHMFNEKENGPGERTAILLEDGMFLFFFIIFNIFAFI